MADDNVEPPACRTRDRLPHPCRDEQAVVRALLGQLPSSLSWDSVAARAAPWVAAVRTQPAPFWALESLLKDYPLSSAEGIALMRLAEALLRVPDAATAMALTADQLRQADFAGPASSDHPVIANLSSSVIGLSRRLLPEGEAPGGLLQRLGAQTVVAATVRAVQLLGRQFVLGRDMPDALAEARRARRSGPGPGFSYDMLGEGARSDADALRYLAAYRQALAHIAQHAQGNGPEERDGMSIKLSALFPRHEEAQRGRVMDVLLPRAMSLVEAAADADIHLTVDAEESDRLELSLDVFEALARRAHAAFPGWRGLGLAVQAYQSRSREVVDEVVRLARSRGQRFMVRLVKGAYWDGEIKRAQELGLPAYPVFTHKHHTDIAYLACAARLIEHADVVYPQFATHNAGTIAAIQAMARAGNAPHELQRLHGMGEAIYREVLQAGDARVRVYAPVGEHRDLLAYLVRRLLENGANSSFVHQLTDDAVPVEQLLQSPLHVAEGSGVPLPAALYGWDGRSGRRNANGVDLAVRADRALYEQAVAEVRVGPVPEARVQDVGKVMAHLHHGFAPWAARPLAERASVLRRAADALEARVPEFCGLLVREAHKTLGDCVAEVREAIDFCRYYADLAEASLASQHLPGPTGETNTLHLRGRGVFICISPWNFPLAIFAGQVAAALVTGNAVAAKPAEQTPAVAARFVTLLHAAGVPGDALALVHGAGDTVGAALVAHPLAAGVCFTGSTAVARSINRAIAAKDGPIVPLIAETGGINAMVVDSTALPEQVVDAVVQSAFRSAGQRCSALRLLCVHEAIAEQVIDLIAGALRELVVGDPACVATDVGPLIDAQAHASISRELERLALTARTVARAPLPAGLEGNFFAPAAFEIDGIEALKEEVFGPVLHIVRWSGDPADTIARINALGYGLTLGLQTRIDSRALRLAALARVGNVYVNRNMIGAVVGVQPFGGEGLSGTGPKAGGPHYLLRFCAEQTVTINTAAAGGNAALLSGAAPA
ncbi:L-glutamate gamma-semialdehyde dehydrogenase [Rhizobacter sp. LjRoot28]|uniref:L-glutamate gamma-semialdehyde dehydrogenase n=1 Tax=Rhizobacter sp. LjRoot28 TaxID=3342309 RepID=UPI003ECE3710